MRELPIACSLEADELGERAERWGRLAERALISDERTEGGVRQRYAPAAGVEAELRELVALEAECCAFLDLRVERREDEVVLEVIGPPEADGIVAAFGTFPAKLTSGSAERSGRSSRPG